MYQFITFMVVFSVSSYGSTFKLTINPKEIRVMVIDTGVGLHKDLKDNVQYNSQDDYVDNHGHGTHVAGIIVYGNHLKSKPDKLCPNVKIFSCKYFDPKQPRDNLKDSIECVKKATKLKMDYINYSGGGTEFSIEEYLAYRNYVSQGGTVFASAGNNGFDLTKNSYYPSSYSFSEGFNLIHRMFKPIKIYSVQNTEASGKLSKTSNFHPKALKAQGEHIYSTLPNNQYGVLSGTSQSAPAVLHLVLKQRCSKINQKR